MRAIPNDNLNYPVLIKLRDGSSGSGFFFNNNNETMYLVTARHVLFKLVKQDDEENWLLRNAQEMKLLFNNNVEGSTELLELSVNLEVVTPTCDPENDVAIVKIANYVEQDGRRTISFFDGVTLPNYGGEVHVVSVTNSGIKMYEDVLVSNEVYISGYPSSLGNPNEPQINYKTPLLRKGIVAGKNDVQKTLILDCSVYFGNSGGIVIEVEQIDVTGKKFKIIGLVSEYIPFYDELRSLRHGHAHLNIENSGYSVVVPMDTVIELINSSEEAISS